MSVNEITRENIETMVMNFYRRVLQDDLVGPFFIATMDEVYEPQISEQFKERSSIIAGNFMRNFGLA